MSNETEDEEHDHPHSETNDVIFWTIVALEACSILLNFFIIFILNKTKLLDIWLTKKQITASASSILYAFVHMITVPAIHFHHGEFLIAYSGFHTNLLIGRILLSLFILLFIQNTVTLAYRFIHLYSVSSNANLSLQTTSIFPNLVRCSVILSSTVLFVISTWPAKTEIQSVFDIPSGCFLAADIRDNVLFIISVCYLLLITLVSSIIIIYTSIYVNRRILLNVKEMKTQRRLFKTLLIQSVCPVLFIYIPLLLTIIVPFVTEENELVETFPFVFAFFPLVEAIIVVIRLKLYKFVCKKKVVDNTKWAVPVR